MNTEEQTIISIVEDDLPLSDEELRQLNESEKSVEDAEDNSENEIVSEETTEKTTAKADAETKSAPKEDKLNPYEQVILAEMKRRADGGDTLVADALKSKDKTIHDCFAYVKAQAQKRAKNGCAMIEDAVVYGWAHHYYIEPKSVIDAELHPKPKATPKTGTATKPATAKPIPTKTETKPKKKSTYNDNPLLKSLSNKARKEDDTKKKGGETTKKVKKGGFEFTITEFSLF